MAQGLREGMTEEPALCPPGARGPGRRKAKFAGPELEGSGPGAGGPNARPGPSAEMTEGDRGVGGRPLLFPRVPSTPTPFSPTTAFYLESPWPHLEAN